MRLLYLENMLLTDTQNANHKVYHVIYSQISKDRHDTNAASR